MSRSAPTNPEERLRAFLLSEAETAMSMTDTQAELERFRANLPGMRRRRRAPWLAAAAAMVVATGAVAVALTTGDTGRPTPAAGSPVVHVAPEQTTPLASAVVERVRDVSGSAGQAVYPAAGAFWRLVDERTVERTSGAGAVTTVELPVVAFEPFVAAGGLVWFTGEDAGREGLFGLDPNDGALVRSNTELEGARSVGAGPAGLWVVTGDRELTEIDPVSGSVVRSVSTEQSVYDVHVGEGAVYSGPAVAGSGLTVVDTGDGSVRTVLRDVAVGPVAVTPEGDLWLFDGTRGSVSRYDGATLEEQVRIELGLRTSRGIRRDFQWIDGRRSRTTEGFVNNTSAYPTVAGGVLYTAYNLNGSARLLRADAETGEVRDVVTIASGAAVGPVTLDYGSVVVAWRGTDQVRYLTYND